MNTVFDPSVYAAMQTGSPYRSYIKTVLGQIYVNVLDPFSGEPAGIFLKGNPKGKGKEKCIVDVWDEKQDVFFRRANVYHFNKGYLLEYKRTVNELPKEKTILEYTDEELSEKILKLRFTSLQSQINKIEQAAVLVRLIDLARENESSEKVINTLESKLAELQEKEFTGQE